LLKGLDRQRSHDPVLWAAIECGSDLLGQLSRQFSVQDPRRPIGRLGRNMDQMYPGSNRKSPMSPSHEQFRAVSSSFNDQLTYVLSRRKQFVVVLSGAVWCRLVPDGWRSGDFGAWQPHEAVGFTDKANVTFFVQTRGLRKLDRLRHVAKIAFWRIPRGVEWRGAFSRYRVNG
jgi:hypothetical protein